MLYDGRERSTMSRLDPFTEEVNGTIIGGEGYYYYEFWTTKPFPPLNIGPYRFGRGWFADDKEAEEWCKENHPEEYKQVVEMRCYD